MRPLVRFAVALCGLAILGAEAFAQVPSLSPAAPAAQAPADDDDEDGPPRVRGAGAPAEVLRRGKLLYQQRCAGCHEHPVGRVPPRSAITVSRSPEYVFRVLTNGAMMQQAAGLADDDKKAIAAYLMGRLPLAAASADPLGNRCPTRPKPINLNGSNWIGWGGRGTSNTRYQPNPGLRARDVPKLKLKWAFALPGPVSSQATIVGDRIFVPTMTGSMVALDRQSGCTLWATDLGAPVRNASSVAALPGMKFAVLSASNKGDVFALDADTGKVLWRTVVEEHQFVRMTGSPTLYDGRLYVPVSSFEEGADSLPDYVCCTFRGSVVVMDVVTGRVIYKSFMLEPAKPLAGGVQKGPAGVAIWSAPTIDPARKLIYVGTGNSYTHPAAPTSDAVVALDLQSGEMKWISQVTPHDAVGSGCPRDQSSSTCVPNPGPDYDLGSSPLLITSANGKQALIATSKSGEVIRMDLADQGKILWRNKVGRGGPQGGVQWGGASDGERIYASVSDTNGGFAARSAPGRPGLYALSLDGALLWSVPSPKVACGWGAQQCVNGYYAAPIVIPGVVFAGSFDGRERAYAAEDGRLLWEFDTGRNFDAVNGVQANGGSIDQGGQTIAGGTLLVISGARNGYPGNALLAFTVDGK